MDSETKKWFDKQIKFSMKHQRYEDCPYYPCHEIPENQSGLNCFFCYCPCYPCAITERGGTWTETASGRIWDCTGCRFIHRDEIVERIIELFNEGKNIDTISYIIQQEYES